VRYCGSFPDIGCEHAVAELEKRGYRLDSVWNWEPPQDHEPTEEERFWIGFLADEWDFGGLYAATERAHQPTQEKP
jgi:hypothetical protein